MKEARRDARLSQTALAAEVGCKQSALSMFEQGDGTKLNDEVIGLLLKKFNISIEEEKRREEGFSPSACVVERVPIAPHTAFCPNASCPSHTSYFVEGRRLLRPDRAQQDPVGGRFCAVCGELLERRCPNCGAPVHEGAICSLCGEPYVAVASLTS